MATIDELLGGRGLYGQAGMNVENVLGSYFSDPRASQLGRFGLFQNQQSEGAGSWESNSQDWSQRGRLQRNGQEMIQLGDFFERGRNRNQDDILRLVRDPNQIQYDEQGGLITNPENFIYKPDDSLDRIMAVVVPAMLGGAAFSGGALGGEAMGYGGNAQAYPGIEGGLSVQQGPQFNQLGALGEANPTFQSFGSGSGGLFGGGSGSSGGLGLDPYEIDMAAGSVSNNSPGLLERAGNFGRESLNNPGGLLNRTGSWAMNNPLDAIRAGSGLANLIGGIRGPGGSSGGSGNKGGGSSAMNIQRPQYQPNPHTQAQYRQLYGG